MTVDDFVRDVRDGKIVYCEDIYQAMEVLDLLENLGFTLYETSEDIAQNIQQSIANRCYSPGIDRDGEIVLYFNYYVEENLLGDSQTNSKVLMYEEISSLLKDDELPSDEDFMKKFQILCGIAG